MEDLRGNVHKRPRAFSIGQLSECHAEGALARPGCYSLIIDLKRKKTIRVGKLGKAVFPVGTYVYTGSAMKGLRARLRRHCTQKKKIHWHIDHLLTLPDARIKKIILYPAAPGQECRQNKRITALPGATVILKNFGASDCRSRCLSHLIFLPKISCRNFDGRANCPSLVGSELISPWFSYLALAATL